MQKSDQKVYVNSGNEDVLNLVSGTNNLILDVGCGSGTLAGILSKSGNIVDGITISPQEKKEASLYAREVYIYNLEKGLPSEVKNNKYDYVICSHVLEHIVYPAQLLNDINNVLKSGGYLVVALPNLMHYKARLKLIFGDFSYQEAGLWDYTHVKWYTFKSAQTLLQNHAFQIDLANVTGDLPLNSIFSKVLSRSLSKLFYKLLTGISKGLFGYQILIRARKQGEK